MRRRLVAGVVSVVVATAMAVPAVGLANKGGTPHKSSPTTAATSSPTTPPTFTCPAHSNKGKHKGEIKNGTKGKRNGSTKGHKCGESSEPTGAP